ncbi:aminotransferase class IV [Rhodococcus erythropolis]
MASSSKRATSSVVARFGAYYFTPPDEHAILSGTTQESVQRILAAVNGSTMSKRPISRSALERCDGLWLVSRGRKVTPVGELDGAAMPMDRQTTDLLLAGLGADPSRLSSALNVVGVHGAQMQ